MASYGYTFSSGDGVTPTRLNAARTVSDIVNADISASAAIALSKLATGALPTAITVASANLVDGTIVNADINASAAIAGSKLADSSVTPAKLSQPYTLLAAQNSTSGSFIDFTGIPSWAKRITVMLNGVSFAGTAHMLIQIGSGGFTTSGYGSWSSFLQGSTGASGVIFSGSGFAVYLGSATNSIVGAVRINLLTGNTWIAEGVGVYNNSGAQMFTAGNVALSGALDRVRITRSDASDTFDGGTINISYEG